MEGLVINMSSVKNPQKAIAGGQQMQAIDLNNNNGDFFSKSVELDTRNK